MVVKPEGGPAVSMKPGQNSCVIKSIKSAYTLSALSLVKHLKDDEATDEQQIIILTSQERYV